MQALKVRISHFLVVGLLVLSAAVSCFTAYSSMGNGRVLANEAECHGCLWPSACQGGTTCKEVACSSWDRSCQ
jgi:hypothetical protein